MKIAHLLPYTAHFPLTKHNGRYEWALRLAQHQVADGHSVTIYAAPGSSDSSSNIQWTSHGPTLGDAEANNLANLEFAFLNQKHDIYHSHFDFLHYLVADITDKPVVVTHHWFPNTEISQAVSANSRHNVVAVPVTRFMAAADRRLGIPVTEVIYHGIDLQRFRYVAQPKTNRLIFVGRVAPHKGVQQAVEIAQAAGAELDIVGKINPSDMAYWQSIAPQVDGVRIRYLGAKPQAEVAALFGQAKALLFPAQVEEAFPQTIVEAQACGTPVIARDIGAAHELVQAGKTGFIAKNKNDYLKAIAKINSIKRADCRAFAEKFDINDMVAKYEALYNQLLS